MWYMGHYSLRFQQPAFERVDFVNKSTLVLIFPKGANWKAAAEGQSHQHARTSLGVISDD